MEGDTGPGRTQPERLTAAQPKTRRLGWHVRVVPCREPPRRVHCGDQTPDLFGGQALEEDLDGEYRADRCARPVHHLVLGRPSGLGLDPCGAAWPGTGPVAFGTSDRARLPVVRRGPPLAQRPLRRQRQAPLRLGIIGHDALSGEIKLSGSGAWRVDTRQREHLQYRRGRELTATNPHVPGIGMLFCTPPFLDRRLLVRRQLLDRTEHLTTGAQQVGAAGTGVTRALARAEVTC
ncbi:hypothetical protein [Ornithinimicrobium kibberense]|uniref:hypothetical protein n=1 Tax=Ornithinimicrobium kibberense TaxID=282060 RepID=UPI003608E879